MLFGSIEAILFFAVAYVLPAFFILRDRRVTMTERALWLVATLLVSWLAFFLFLWIAPVFGSPSESETEAGEIREGETEKSEAEESTAAETSRRILVGMAGTGVAIAFGAGLFLLALGYGMVESSPGLAFFAGIPIIAGVGLMIPGVVAVVVGGIRVLGAYLGKATGISDQGLASAVGTLVICVLGFVILFNYFINDRGSSAGWFAEIAAMVCFLFAAASLVYMLVRLVSGLLTRKRL